MAELPPVDFADVPELAGLRAGDQVIVSDLSQPLANQAGRISADLLQGAKMYGASVSLAAKQTVNTGDIQAIGTGLSVNVPASAGIVVVFVTVWIEGLRASNSSFQAHLLRSGVEIAYHSQNLESFTTNDPFAVTFLIVDMPGNAAATYSVEVGKETSVLVYISHQNDSAIVAVRVG